MMILYFLEAGYVNEKKVSTKNGKAFLLAQRSDRDDEVYETPYSDTQSRTKIMYQNNGHDYAEYSKSKNKEKVIF